MYERAVEFFGEENADEKLFLAFGKFEENCKEVYTSNCIKCCHIEKNLNEKKAKNEMIKKDAK